MLKFITFKYTFNNNSYNFLIVIHHIMLIKNIHNPNDFKLFCLNTSNFNNTILKNID